jgi:hypothetical protein
VTVDGHVNPLGKERGALQALGPVRFNSQMAGRAVLPLHAFGVMLLSATNRLPLASVVTPIGPPKSVESIVFVLPLKEAVCA